MQRRLSSVSPFESQPSQPVWDLYMQQNSNRAICVRIHERPRTFFVSFPVTPASFLPTYTTQHCSLCNPLQSQAATSSQELTFVSTFSTLGTSANCAAGYQPDPQILNQNTPSIHLNLYPLLWIRGCFNGLIALYLTVLFPSRSTTF
jgi:hypothetical protein